MSVVKPLAQDRATTWKLTFAFLEADRVTPVPITGWTARFLVFEHQDGPFFIDANMYNGQITIDGPAGLVHVVIPYTETEIPDKTYTYNLKVMLPGAAPQDELLKLRGPFTVQPGSDQVV